MNKETFINKLPDAMFAFLVNLRRQKLYGDRISIERRDKDWIIRSGKIQLYSFIPKMTSFGMGLFSHKFEKYFRIEKGDTCLDVGACIGDTAIPMAIKSEYGSIIAVEPEPRNLKYLKKNAILYPNIQVRPRAIANRNGMMDLYISDSLTGHSLIFDKQSRNVSKIKVPCETLDSFLAKYRHIDFAKIDVQEAEANIFQTATNFLTNVKKLVVETHNYFDPKRESASSVLPYLKPHFDLIEITDKGVIHCRK